MKALALVLLLVSGCSYMAEGIARCKAQYGPDASYNGIADRCVDLAAPVNMAPMLMMMPYLNQPTPSPRYYNLPPLTPPPMNRCQSLVIGNQIQTTCY